MQSNHSNREIDIKLRSGSLVWAVQILSIISIFLLMITSHRLWIPNTGSNFPEVPALAITNSASTVWDYGALLLLLVGLTSSLWLIARSLRLSEPRTDSAAASSSTPKTHSPSQWLWWLVIVAGIGLVLLNQHRLQAWFYHLLIFSLIFTLKQPDDQLKWLRRIVVSVYVYSALGKLDFEFVHTVGQDFLEALASLLGLSVADWSDNDRIVVTLLFPIIELAIGVGLAIHKTRRASGVAAILFHLTLAALVFGPLKHSWGVFLWNLQFAIQAMLLFAWPSTVANSSTSHATLARSQMQGSWLERIVRTGLFAILLLPLGERMGYWDHWPSWGLYAPHSSRVRVTVARFSFQQLPDSLQQVLKDEDLEETEVELPLARWSFRELGVPIYPQARFQLGVARRIAESLESEFAIRVEIRSSADRFTGERKTIILNGSREIRQTAGPFWLGSRPRRSN